MIGYTGLLCINFNPSIFFIMSLYLNL